MRGLHAFLLVLAGHVLTACAAPPSSGSPCYSNSNAFSGGGDGVAKRVRDIVTNKLDNRLYRGLELKNGMTVLLISDPTTEQAAAAMAVGVGYMNDPDDVPGLAHFCEHMLFLGTKEFPEENGYSKFLSEHGGYSNAYTATDLTNFYFNVQPQNLEEALHRFSQFFICPLFNEDATEREVNAVNLEHEKNIPNDDWRRLNLETSFSKPGHPYAKFGTGNKKTLLDSPKEMGIDPRKLVLEFYVRWYSSNIMCLVVLGAETLDELERMVVPIFSHVPNKNVSLPRWLDQPYGEEQVKRMMAMIPIRDLHTLRMHFPIPDLQEFYSVRPFAYLSYHIGHEGKGSLLSELKLVDRWATSLSAQDGVGARGFGLFTVAIDLTEDGIEHIDDILIKVFQRRIFDEIQQMRKLAFEYKDKEDPIDFVRDTAKYLMDVLSGPYLLREADVLRIKQALGYLKPTNMWMLAISKKLAIAPGYVWLTDPWYGTQYSVRSFNAAFIEALGGVPLLKNFFPPLPNKFIPRSLGLYPQDVEMLSPLHPDKENLPLYPYLLYQSPLLNLWYKQDNEFFTPKSLLFLEIKSPVSYEDPRHTCMLILFTMFLKDSLNEASYEAGLAGLGYDLQATKYGITMTLSGYSDKQDTLLSQILERMVALHVDPSRLEVFRRQLGRNLANFLLEQPYVKSSYYMNALLVEKVWTTEELQSSLEGVTVEDMRQFPARFFGDVFLECFIHGNVNKQRAQQVLRLIQSSFRDSKPIPNEQITLHREYIMPEKSSYLYTLPYDAHNIHAVEAHYQYSPEGSPNHALMQLFAQIVRVPAYSILRTKEQLGYIVLSFTRKMNCVQGLSIAIQSDKDPAFLDQRIEHFWTWFQGYLRNMPQEEFESHKAALRKLLLSKPKKLAERTNKLWAEIANHEYKFNRDTLESADLGVLTREDVLLFYEKYVRKGSRLRRKLSVYVMPSGHNEASARPQDGDAPHRIESIKDFKSDLSLCSLPKPFYLPELFKVHHYV